MDYLSNYQLVYEVNEAYQQLLSMKITQGLHQQTYIELLLSSYKNIYHSIVPQKKNQNCYIDIQQQNRPIENFYTTIQLFQNLISIERKNQQLSSYTIKLLRSIVYLKYRQSINQY
ncbi:hypothetical protein ABPG72_015317 [Tetrahymena utriculariae]